ncbi:MAG: tryptophan halogenase [Alphaproteobacteria bacterium]|jgi:tryptophan halogenase
MSNNSQPSSLRKQSIVIVGGGSAGWMSAAAFATHLSPEHFHITLVESKDIGTVSVGEATIPGILEFNQMLGINEAEFLAFTKGSFKLGIIFKDWYEKGNQYMHPFGAYGVNIQGLPFHHYLLQDKADSGSSMQNLSPYCIEYAAALNNKFSHPQPQSRSPLASIKYAYHFDATLYAQFLQQLACSKGVVHIQDYITDVSQHPNGDIASITLANGPAVEGDIFIDCSGFKGLLINQTLGVKFEDWRQYLPCDSAIAMPSETLEELKPYTISSAHENGWQWQIPLQHRVGNGFVYASEFLNEQNAIDQLSTQLPSKAIGEPRTVKWINGKRKNVWEKNCIAIGLSAGFIEPLESTGLQLVQSAITRLLSLWPNLPVAKAVRDQFNAYTNDEIDAIRDFVILHYVANKRRDSSFWQHCQQITLPERLQNKIALYESSGNIFRDNNELFNEISWFSVLNGQGLTPTSYHPLANNLPAASRKQYFKTIAGAMQEASASMLDHGEYLAKYIAQS